MLDVTNDSPLRRLLKNANMQFLGNGTASILGLASMAITVRALGAEQFGILVLAATYVKIVGNFVNFQSWQAVIKYGALEKERSQDGNLRALIKFGLILDCSTALFGAIVGILAVWIVGSYLFWSHEQKLIASVYSLTILFNISGVPIAVLRIFDEFKKTAVQQIYTSLVKFCCVILVFIFDKNLYLFLAVWGLSDIFGNIILFFYAKNVLRKNNIVNIAGANVARLSYHFRGIWKFVWATNLNSSLKSITREVDVVLVAALLGPREVGLYKVAKQFSLVIQRVVDPLYQAIYPELAKIYSRNNVKLFASFCIKSSVGAFIIAFSIWLIFVYFADFIIFWTVGDDFLPAKLVACLYMMAVVISAASFPLQPAMLSLGRAHLSLYVHIVSTAVYVVFMYYLVEIYGLAGVGFSYILYYAVWSLMMLALLYRMLKV